MNERTKAHVEIDGEDTGHWMWKNKEDFVKFLRLMHNQTIANDFEVDEMPKFSATYVWYPPTYSKHGPKPTIRKYIYTMLEIRGEEIVQ
jgi:hypothetical protein